MTESYNLVRPVGCVTLNISAFFLDFGVAGGGRCRRLLPRDDGGDGVGGGRRVLVNVANALLLRDGIVNWAGLT